MVKDSIGTLDVEYKPEVRDVVKLRNETVTMVRSGKPFRHRDLGTEVAQDKHRGRVWAKQDRADKNLKLFRRRVHAVKTMSALFVLN